MFVKIKLSQSELHALHVHKIRDHWTNLKIESQIVKTRLDSICGPPLAVHVSAHAPQFEFSPSPYFLSNLIGNVLAQSAHSPS